MENPKDLRGPQAKLLRAEKNLMAVGAAAAPLLASIAALKTAAAAADKVIGAENGGEKLPEIENLTAQLADTLVAIGDRLSDLHAGAQHAATRVGATFIENAPETGGHKLEQIGVFLRQTLGG